MRIRNTALFLTFLFTATLAGAEPDTPVANVYAMRYTTASNILTNLKNAHTDAEKTAVIKALDDLSKLPSSLRFDGSKIGELVRIYGVYRDEGKEIALSIAEKSRQPLIAAQFKTLVQVANAVAAAAGEPDIKVERFDYRLKLRRATLTIDAVLTDEGSDAVSDPLKTPDWIVVIDFTNGGEKKNAGQTSVAVLTGPREPWSISADVPVASIGDVKVDDDVENIDLKDTPDVFYAGFNYSPFGDVLRPPNGLLEAINLKAMLKISRRPSDSFGIGIGVRSGLFANYPVLQILDTISPYVAYTRTRGEEERDNAAGVKEKVRFKRTDFVVGISLDIDKALGFVKGAGGGDDGEEEGDDQN